MTSSATGAKLAPREPMRANGRDRYERLLDAAEHLLSAGRNARLTLERIARHAGATQGSAYHFFPSVEAVYVGLARRYTAQFLEMLADLERMAPARGWQDLLREGLTAGRDHHNGNPAVMRVLLSYDIPCAVRLQDRQINTAAGRLLAAALTTRYRLGEIPALEERCETAIDISDTFWAKSYNASGFISDEALAESILAATAYLRCYLPETVTPR